MSTNPTSFRILLLGLVSTLIANNCALAQQWRNKFQRFAEAHCVACHEGPDAAAALDLSDLEANLDDEELTRRWTLVHDRLSRGEMPPPEQARPDESERRTTLTTLAKAIRHAERRRADVVLRRLNRVEYENTINDLFDVNVRLKQMLPEDTSAHGFDNVGEGLAVSPAAMQSYLRAADAALDAVFGPAKKPTYIKLKTNLVDQKGHDGKSFIDRHIGTMFRRTDKGLVIFQSGYCPTTLVNFSRLRPAAGTYRASFQVRAVQSDKPVTLRVYGGDTLVNRRERHLVGYFDVPPDTWTTIEFEDRLVEEGGTFQPKCYGTRDTRKDADTYPEPGIEIGDIMIEGPLETWPPPSRSKLLGEVDPEEATAEDARSILERILPLAFRRAIEPSEVEPYVQLVKTAMAEDRSFEDALRLALKSVLCSPEFLFLDEPGQPLISQYAVASRLSYFLWSSMPDAELMTLATQKQLADPDMLHKQVERMLNHPKSQAFTRNFTGQWLDLRDIDFTEPDMNLYPEFDELLKISMVEETERFFGEVLEQDFSLMNFVDCDFTFVNERLARHYGISGVTGQEFQKVSLPSDSVRGGLLTQAAVLKVTANGTNTSPVVRGNWVLENILGRPTPPPPDGIGSVEPDIRGATTLREQLAKHRQLQSCATCHKRIDPPGFALENFDPIGGWREHYRTVGEGERPDFKQAPFTFAWVRYRIGLPVDASGETSGGDSFDDIRQFKQLLGREQDQLARCLTEKLMTYALGRRIGFSDRPAIEQIVSRLQYRDYGFRTLVHQIVQSELFQRP